MSSQKTDTDGMFIIFSIVFFVGISMFILFVVRPEYMYVRTEVNRLYVEGLMSFFNALPFDITPESLKKSALLLDVYDSAEIKESDYSFIGFHIFLYFIPFILLMAFLYFFKLKSAESFTRKFTIKTLMKDQASVWSFLRPIVDLKLDENIEDGEWAMAKRPLSWVKKYRLLDSNKVLKEQEAESLFERQVGRLYDGFDSLKDYEKGLLCIFAAHSELTDEAKKDAYKWNDILNITYKKQDYSWVNEAWEKYKNTEKLKLALSQHAFVTTILMRMLEEARGVFPTSYFLWLKPVDRTLFFALNRVGSKESFCECAGVFNHFLAEKVLGQPLMKQYVKGAVSGLKYHLEEIEITDKNYYNLKENLDIC